MEHVNSVIKQGVPLRSILSAIALLVMFITIIPAEGVEVEEGDTFTVTYRYIDDLPQYLNDLIAHIQSLIQL